MNQSLATMCRQCKHSSKLSLVLLGTAALPDGAQLSKPAALSLGLARTLFMEDRPVYGPTIQLLPASGQLPSLQVRDSQPNASSSIPCLLFGERKYVDRARQSLAA